MLHDAVLQHFFLGSLDARTGTSAEFVHNYDEWSRDRSGADVAGACGFFSGSALFRPSDAEAYRGNDPCAVVVHNPAAAAEMVREHAPGANEQS